MSLTKRSTLEREAMGLKTGFSFGMLSLRRMGLETPGEWGRSCDGDLDEDTLVSSSAS